MSDLAGWKDLANYAKSSNRSTCLEHRRGPIVKPTSPVPLTPSVIIMAISPAHFPPNL